MDDVRIISGRIDSEDMWQLEILATHKLKGSDKEKIDEMFAPENPRGAVDWSLSERLFAAIILREYRERPLPEMPVTEYSYTPRNYMSEISPMASSVGALPASESPSAGGLPGSEFVKRP